MCKVYDALCLGAWGAKREGAGLSEVDIMLAKIMIATNGMKFDKGVKTTERYEAALAVFAEMPERKQEAYKARAQKAVADEAERVAREARELAELANMTFDEEEDLSDDEQEERNLLGE
jgi:hypothetical protein